MSILNKLPRLIHYSRPWRERFGLISGMQLALQLHKVERRPRSAPAFPLWVPGWQHPVWLRPGTDDAWVFRQLVLNRELDLDLEPTPRRILDGGANIGMASFVFARQWPDVEIVAVELEPSNFERLRINLAPFSGIQAFNAALWGDEGRVTVAPLGPGDGECGFRVGTAAGDTGVPAVTVGGILDEVGWETVDLVKLDIEGAEREVLADADQWLHRVNHIVLELHDRFAPGCRAAFDRAIDPKGWTIRENGEYLIASRRS